jgi:ribosomal protein L29
MCARQMCTNISDAIFFSTPQMSTPDNKETDVSLLSPEKVGSTVSQLKIKIKETLNTDSGGLTKKAACMQVRRRIARILYF